jgi:hypothetical protein
MKYTKEYLISNKIAIECTWQGEAETICKILGVEPKHEYSVYVKSCFLSFNQNSQAFSFYTRKVVVSYGETIIPASEVIADYEASQKPKGRIIGYKVPFDTFNGSVKMGTIYVKADCGYMYYPETNSYGSLSCNLPAEIVESWEPVYEESKPTFGSFEDIIKYAGKVAIVAIKDTIVLHNCPKLSNLNDDVTKEKFNFTTEFEQTLQKLGIKI